MSANAFWVFKLPRDRALSVTCQGQLSLEETFLINDKMRSKKFFRNCIKHSRLSLIGIFSKCLKHRMFAEGTIVTIPKTVFVAKISDVKKRIYKVVVLQQTQILLKEFLSNHSAFIFYSYMI